MMVTHRILEKDEVNLFGSETTIFRGHSRNKSGQNRKTFPNATILNAIKTKRID